MRRGGTIDKFECSSAPLSDLQLFSAAPAGGVRATATPSPIRRVGPPLTSPSPVITGFHFLM